MGRTRGTDHPKFKAQQWKPGQSGNPKGSQKRPTFESLVARILDEKIPGEDDVSKRELLARVFVDGLLKKNAALFREFLAREWPAVQKVDLTTEPRSHTFLPDEDTERKLLEEFRGHDPINGKEVLQ